MADIPDLLNNKVLQDIRSGERWLEYDPFQSEKDNKHYWRAWLMPENKVIGRSDQGYLTEEERDTNALCILYLAYNM